MLEEKSVTKSLKMSSTLFRDGIRLKKMKNAKLYNFFSCLRSGNYSSVKYEKVLKIGPLLAVKFELVKSMEFLSE